MIIKPAGMSRRGFLRNVLGVTTALILPWRPRETALTGMPYLLTHRPYLYIFHEQATLKRIICPVIDVNGVVRGHYVGNGTDRRVITLGS